MDIGASSPEELETLLEDSFVQRDATAVAGLFEEDGLLVCDLGDEPSAGRAAVLRTASVLCGQNRAYVAETHAVWQSGDIALLVGENAVSVVRRGRDGCWRYVISHLRTLNESRDAAPCGGRLRAGRPQSLPPDGAVR
jgi:hypothetical protein